MSFRLSNNRCEEIKELVVKTFEELNICCIPISGFEIATKLGVAVIPYSSKDEEAQQLMLVASEDGFSLKRNDIWYIFYNDSKDYRRINNTLTHECAHIILDHSERSDLAEAEAKFFAKYAIAPPPLVHKLELKNPQEIFSHFDISFEAAVYAYNYYLKWLTFGEKDYTNYEIRLLTLFDEAM